MWRAIDSTTMPGTAALRIERFGVSTSAVTRAASYRLRIAGLRYLSIAR